MAYDADLARNRSAVGLRGKATGTAVHTPGHDWTHRFGELAEAISSIPRISSLTMDAEACVCGSGGVPVFALLHSGSYDSAVVLYAFDLLELNGKDWRPEPLEIRKAKLAKLVERADPSRLGYTDHAQEDGAAIFRHACKGWKGSFLSVGIFLTAPAGAKLG